MPWCRMHTHEHTATQKQASERLGGRWGGGCAHAGDTQLFEGRIKSKMLSDYVP